MTGVQQRADKNVIGQTGLSRLRLHVENHGIVLQTVIGKWLCHDPTQVKQDALLHRERRRPFLVNEDPQRPVNDGVNVGNIERVTLKGLEIPDQ